MGNVLPSRLRCHLYLFFSFFFLHLAYFWNWPSNCQTRTFWLKRFSLVCLVKNYSWYNLHSNLNTIILWHLNGWWAYKSSWAKIKAHPHPYMISHPSPFLTSSYLPIVLLKKLSENSFGVWLICNFEKSPLSRTLKETAEVTQKEASPRNKWQVEKIILSTTFPNEICRNIKFSPLVSISTPSIFS